MLKSKLFSISIILILNQVFVNCDECETRNDNCQCGRLIKWKNPKNSSLFIIFFVIQFYFNSSEYLYMIHKFHYQVFDIF
jgi:uncharacterized sodium:solute symporter family permease YidK